jgi:hypothetical protein
VKICTVKQEIDTVVFVVSRTECPSGSVKALWVSLIQETHAALLWFLANPALQRHSEESTSFWVVFDAIILAIIGLGDETLSRSKEHIRSM